ncbi:MAG: inositol monophosphatase [Spirochaetaceae bacterium]|nr:inositol monophosphatase [Spirochaetaceae bacterium]
MIDLEKRLEVAKRVAIIAGKSALKTRDEGKFSVYTKHKNDFVTDVDKTTEELIFSLIKKEFPNDGFFGEEDENNEKGIGRWIVDPIDGTTNFFRGLPNWVVSIAFEIDQFSPLIGVVYAPVFGDLYYAIKGKGSYLNEEKINCSSIDELSNSLIVCVPPHRHKESYSRYCNTMENLGNCCSDMRSYGSCAQELCFIASGHIEAYYELFLGYYDFAAGQVILEEAGGKLTNGSKNHPFSDNSCNIIASNALLHKNIEEIVFGE